MHVKLVLIATSITMLASPLAAQTSPGQSLAELFDAYDRWQLQEFPGIAMQRGDYTHAHRLSDQSLAAIERRHQDEQRFLQRLEAIRRADLTAADQVSRDLFDLKLRRQIEGHRHRSFLAPMGARFGPQQSVPQMCDRVRFDSVLDYENYLERLAQIPRMIEQQTARMRAGMAEGRVPPRVVMEGVPDQFHSLLEEDGLHRLGEPLEQFPVTITPEQRQALRDRFEKTVFPAAHRALATLGRFVREEYIPACRETIAASNWPDGKAYYAHQLRTMTTTDLTADAIHRLGQREVARIRGEMMDVIRRSDFMDVHPEASALDDGELFRRFIGYLRSDPRFYHQSPEDLLAGYRAICKEIDGHMPSFFARLPRLAYGVKEIPAFMAPQQTTAYYQHGDIRNRQAGFFYANTYALDQRPRYEMIALALHEAVPGHHHQIALAQELEDVPEFRRETWFTAFGEGWALYAERLGIEMGLYEDPYDDFGRLLYEMWRACRLVVDPGMHALGWSRERAIDFMLENTALSELNITTEVDRYIAWPGQATAYKIGELKIRELRERAEAALGEDMDLRLFHDVVLEAGCIPLSMLEERIDRWIIEQQTSTSSR